MGIVSQVIEVTVVDLRQLRNDSMAVKAMGKMPEVSATGLQFNYGKTP